MFLILELIMSSMMTGIVMMGYILLTIVSPLLCPIMRLIEDPLIVTFVVMI